jgi:hypothetical protein
MTSNPRVEPDAPLALLVLLVVIVAAGTLVLALL